MLQAIRILIHFDGILIVERVILYKLHFFYSDLEKIQIKYHVKGDIFLITKMYFLLVYRYDISYCEKIETKEGKNRVKMSLPKGELTLLMGETSNTIVYTNSSQVTKVKGFTVMEKKR